MSKAYKVQMLKAEQILEYEGNPRQNAAAVEKVATSIRDYGWRVPIVVDENNVILAGHTRLKAARLLELKDVPVHVAQGLSEEQKTAYRIMDNKSQDLAEWDNELLRVEFEKLAGGDFDLDMTGFDIEEINKITKGALLKFDAPDLEMSEEDWLGQDVHIPETNVKQYMLLFDISDVEEIKTMVEGLREIYKIESPSDIVFRAVKNEYEKHTNL
jgi:hypothetical protein